MSAIKAFELSHPILFLEAVALTEPLFANPGPQCHALFIFRMEGLCVLLVCIQKALDFNPRLPQVFDP